MIDDLSPEEKLLRLIKGKHKKDEPSEKKPEPEAPAESFSAEPAIETRPIVSSILTKGKGIDSFKIAVFLLTGFFIAGTFYFIYDFSIRKQEPAIIDIEELIPAEAEPAEEAQRAGQEALAEKEPAIEEEAPPELRELFGAPVTRETAPIAEEGPPITELAKDLALVGVISGDNPQAIIQNKKTRQSFYVYAGESVLEFKIKQIDKATVILEHKGETLKLSL